MIELNKIYQGDSLEVLKTFPNNFVDCVITSPPYWGLRDYGVEGQIGLENTFQNYIENLLAIFDEIHRILKNTGTIWVNLGDTYGGSGAGTTKNADIEEYKKKSKESYILPNGTAKSAYLRGTKYQKSLLMIPERFAINMIERGWILRNQIIWHKPNAMPSSAKDRFTVDFEKIFFFVKNRKYYFNQVKELNRDTYMGKRGKIIRRHKLQSAMQSEGYSDYYGKGRNKRAVWSINTRPFKGAHFAVFPPTLPEICIKAGCPEGGIVLDPFMGSGTTAVVAKKLNRNFIGIELNKEYIEIANKRINKELSQLDLFKPARTAGVKVEQLALFGEDK